MRRTHHVIPTCALVAGLTLALTACNDSASPSDTGFTADFTNDIGAAQADELDESVGALTLGASGPSAVRASFSGPAEAFRPQHAACATVDDETDSDGDGTPDEATFTFTLPACRFTNFRGGTVEITGTVVMSDPTPDSPGFASRAALDDFRFRYTNPDASRSYTATRNGTRTLAGDAASASLSNDVTTVRSATGRPDATIRHNTMLTFTPDQGATLQRGEPLPSGTFSLSGTLTWRRSARSHTFTVTTMAPLRWDATCTTDRKISAGEIHWVRSNGSYIRMVWTACGVDPTREFVPASGT
jgi:hypothetical protein